MAASVISFVVRMNDCKLFTKPKPSETSGLRCLTRKMLYVTGTELGQSGEQWLPLAFPSRPFRGLPPGATPAALPSPILRRLASTSQSRAAPRSAWLQGAPVGQPLRAGRHARARGEVWPLAGVLGRARPEEWR